MKRLLLFAALFAATMYNASAYDFSSVSPSGHTLYYNYYGNNVECVVPLGNVMGWYDLPKPIGNLIIPDSVTNNGSTYAVVSIGQNAFAGCGEITSVVLPNVLQKISRSAFGGCNQLQSITIPSSVMTIENAFMGCTALTQIVVSDGNPIYDSRENCNAIIETSTNTLVTGCINTIIPTSVTSIRTDAFRGLSLTNINIPNTIISIGSGAFADCVSLASINIPNSVISIGDHAFSGCTGLTSVCIDNAVASINEWAFGGCSNMTTIALGDSVTIIHGYAFENCSSLSLIVIPQSVSGIGNWAFHNCTSLTTVYYNATNSSGVGADSQPMFANCSNLGQIIVGDNVQIIPNYAFKDCTGLTNITIGINVESIGRDALNNCSQLSHIHIKRATPPMVQNNTFVNVPTTATLHVPCDAISMYQNAAHWNQFIIEEEFPYSFSATTDDLSRGSVQVIHSPECGNLQAEVLASPYNGFHFVRWSDGNTEEHRYIVVLQDTSIRAYFDADGDTEGISGVEGKPVNIFQSYGQIVVDGGEGNDVTLYDVNGRVLATKRDYGAPVRFDAPASGTYMIKIGNHPARKVVVIR